MWEDLGIRFSPHTPIPPYSHTISNNNKSAGFGIRWILDRGTGTVVWHGVPPEARPGAPASYRSPVAVGEAYMVVIGSEKVYCLTRP